MTSPEFQDAEHASRNAHWDHAARLWGDLSDHAPDAIRPALEWSLACQKCGDLKGVIIACDRILAIAPHHRTALFRRANALERTAAPALAARAWRRAARHAPEEALPHIRLSRIFRKARRKRAAALAALQAWRRDPRNTDAASIAMACLDPETDCLSLASLWRDRLIRRQDTAPPSPHPPPRLLQALEHQGAFDLLRSLTETMLTRTPEDSSTRARLVLACEGAGDRARARHHLNALPPQEEATRWLLHALDRRDAHDLLRPLAEAMVAADPEDTETREILIHACEAGGDVLRAGHHLEILRAADLDVRRTRMALVRFYERHEHWAPAAELLRPLTLGPQADPALMQRRINRLNRAGHQATLAEALREACEQWPHRADLWLQRLRAAQKRNDGHDVERTISQALEHHPGHRDLLTARARHFWSQRRWADALASWDDLAAGDQDLTAPLLAARCLVNLNRLTEAEARFSRLLRSHPDSAEVARRLVHVRRRLRDLVGAEDASRHWLALDPQAPQAWLTRIDLLIRLGNDEAADSLRQEAEAALPPTAETLVALAAFARRCGHAEMEETLLQKALAEGDVLAVARHHREAGRPGLALTLLRQADDGTDGAFRAERRALEGILSHLGLTATMSDTALTALRLPEAAIAALVTTTPPPASDGRGVALVARSLGAGGAERQVSVTLRGLAERSVAPLFLVTGRLEETDDRGFYAPLLADLPVALHHPDAPEAPVRLPVHARALLDLCSRSFRQDVEAHAALFQRLRPSLVHVWQDALNITGGLAALLAGVPTIVLSARTQPPVHPRAARRATDHLREGYRALLAHPSIHFCVNSHAGAAAYAQWLDVPTESIRVVHNGLDRRWLDMESVGAMPLPPAIPPDAPVVGTVFRFVWQKNPTLWLEVARRVAACRPDCHFLLVGDGPGRTDFAAGVAAAGLNDRVHLVGRVTTVTPWYARMSLFLMTSVVEGLPNAAMEAQASGLPVVATRAGGTAETLREGVSGWTVPLPDTAEGPFSEVADALAERILWCLARPDWLESAGREARRHIERHFSIDAMVDRTLALYETASHRRSDPQEAPPCAG